MEKNKKRKRILIDCACKINICDEKEKFSVKCFIEVTSSSTPLTPNMSNFLVHVCAQKKPHALHYYWNCG